MAIGATVSDELSRVIYFTTGDNNAFSVNLFNTGTQAFVALSLKGYTAKDGAGVTTLDTDADFTPSSGSIVKVIEQRDSSGLRETAAPTTLPAGSSLHLGLATTDSYLKSLYAIEIVARVASGQETIAEAYVGKG